MMFFRDKDTPLVELEAVIDNLPLVILVLDTGRRIVLANREAELFTGLGQDELAGDRPGEAFECEFVDQDERGCGYGSTCKKCFIRNQVIETISKRSGRLTVEGRLKSKKLGSLDMRMTTSFLEPQDYVLVAIEDITELKALEQDRIEKNKLQAAVETAGAVCHEMNQPMQVLLEYIDMLLSSDKQKEHMQEYLSITREQTKRLMEIVGKLQVINRYRTSEYMEGTKILDIAGSSQS